MTYSHFLILLLVALLFPSIAQAQTSPMDGLWKMTLTPPEQNTMTMDMHAETISDSLHLALLMQEDALALTDVALNEQQLRFTVPSSHGLIRCTLYKKDDDTFTGICAGAMGEGVTTLKRVVEKDE